jgi:SAM-dependent methyltransferase
MFGRMAASGPSTDDYWDGVGAAWRDAPRDRLWREFTDLLQASWIDRWLGTVEPAGPNGFRRLLKTDLFDEVAGRGLVGRVASPARHVTGIDISPVIVAEAAARNPGLDAVVADVRRLPFADASFDDVFSGSSLDHFDTEADIDVALRELARVLRPGGRIVVSLDNPLNPLVAIRNGPLRGLLRRLGIVPYAVGATLGRRPLEAAIGRAGFVLRETTAHMHCPRVLAVALAGPAGRLGRRAQKAFLRSLELWEVLERSPTRWWSGHFIAAHAMKP